MTKTDHIFIAAADAGYHRLLADMIASVRRHRGLEEAPFAVFDLGLEPVQRDALAGQGVELATPEWHFDLGGRGVLRHQLGLLVRPFLRDYFPGRRVYAWIDADTWLQDAAAFGRLIAGARDRGFAIAHERERGYRFQAWLTAWIAKHFVLGCGPVHGARLLTKPHLNAGIFAATDTAPHWELWRRRYQAAIARTGRIAPYDQFTLNQAIWIDGPPTTILDPRDNWICDRGPPVWDAGNRRFCKPYAPYEPLTILHLAGPAKRSSYRLRVRSGGEIEARLGYGWVVDHLLASATPAAAD